jgi:hypothetical protein
MDFKKTLASSDSEESTAEDIDIARKTLLGENSKNRMMR